MKKALFLGILSGMVFAGGSSLHADTIFTENMGSPSGTTAISSNVFANSGFLTFTGTGDVRTSTASTGYTGASASGNVFLTNTVGKYFEISSIDTSAFVAGTLDLSFGAFKSTTASNMSELSLQYSTDGTSYSSLTIPAQPTGSGTATWRLISLVDTALPITSTLYLRWTNTSSTPQFRIDDVALTGTLTAVPEPREYGVILAVMLAALVVMRRRRAAHAV